MWEITFHEWCQTTNLIIKRLLKLFETQRLSLTSKNQLKNPSLNKRINTELDLQSQHQKKNVQTENQDLHQAREKDLNHMIVENVSLLKTDLKLASLITPQNLQNLKLQNKVRIITVKVLKFDKSKNTIPLNQYFQKKRILRQETQFNIKNESTEDIQWTTDLQPLKIRSENLINEKAILRINHEIIQVFLPQHLQIKIRKSTNSVRKQSTNHKLQAEGLQQAHPIQTSSFETQKTKFHSNQQQSQMDSTQS